MLNISYLCTRLTHIGVQWCNGSTTGFGSVCGGSESALDNDNNLRKSKRLPFLVPVCQRFVSITY